MKGYEESGLSQPVYCRQQGLKLSTFSYWRHQVILKSKGHSSKSFMAGFVELKSRELPLSLTKYSRMNCNPAYSMSVSIGNARIELSNHFSSAALRDLLLVLNGK
jgi:hypothetical protein